MGFFTKKEKKVCTTNELMIHLTEDTIVEEAFELWYAYLSKDNAFTKKRKAKFEEEYDKKFASFAERIYKEFPFISSWILTFYKDGNKQTPFIKVVKNDSTDENFKIFNKED